MRRRTRWWCTAPSRSTWPAATCKLSPTASPAPSSCAWSAPPTGRVSSGTRPWSPRGSTPEAVTSRSPPWTRTRAAAAPRPRPAGAAARPRRGGPPPWQARARQRASRRTRAGRGSRSSRRPSRRRASPSRATPRPVPLRPPPSRKLGPPLRAKTPWTSGPRTDQEPPPRWPQVFVAWAPGWCPGRWTAWAAPGTGRCSCSRGGSWTGRRSRASTRRRAASSSGTAATCATESTRSWFKR
mmetsp:Transcript_29416/g.65869  ORF Transcript_29416/g.65869 Transcript_29416/m.65869 type:complete len:240 (+) Transcript_29416:2305-3024(+)